MQVYRYHGLQTLFLKIEEIIPISYIYNLTVPLRIYSVFEGLVRILLYCWHGKLLQNILKIIFDIVSLLLMLVAIFMLISRDTIW